MTIRMKPTNEAFRNGYDTINWKKKESVVTGTTTKQMLSAPSGSIYVWLNGNLEYPRGLAHRLCRDDLKIVSVSWITMQHFRARNITGLVIDHAARQLLDFEQWLVVDEVRNKLKTTERK